MFTTKNVTFDDTNEYEYGELRAGKFVIFSITKFDDHYVDTVYEKSSRIILDYHENVSFENCINRLNERYKELHAGDMDAVLSKC